MSEWVSRQAIASEANTVNDRCRLLLKQAVEFHARKPWSSTAWEAWPGSGVAYVGYRCPKSREMTYSPLSPPFLPPLMSYNKSTTNRSNGVYASKLAVNDVKRRLITVACWYLHEGRRLCLQCVSMA